LFNLVEPVAALATDLPLPEDFSSRSAAKAVD